MMSIVEFLSQPLCIRLGMTLVHFLWQGLGVAVLIGLFVRVLGVKHGNGRYGAYLFAFIAMVVFPVVTFTVLDIGIGLDTEVAAEPAPVEMVEISYTELPAVETAYETEAVKTNVSSPAAVTVSVPLLERLSGWLDVSIPWFIAVWMVGVLVLSVRLIMGFVGVYRWRSHLEPLPQRLDRRVASLSDALGMGGFCRVFVSPGVLQAMAVGYFRPMVLLPAAMVTGMQPEMLEAVIAHELAHIRRFDLWVNLLQRVVETLLFYHPAVWWLSNLIRSERELCCDELAVGVTGQRLTYASTLESVSRGGFVARQPVLAAGLGHDNKPTLHRVRHILGLTPAQRNCPFWLAGVIAVGLLAAITIPTTLALTSQADENPGVEVEGGKEASIENLIEAVRQAQRPCENMRVEWTWEPSGEGVSTVTSRTPTAPAKKGGWKYDYTAIFAGIRSRIETRAEFWPEEADNPSSAFTEVGVFDGIKYKSLKRYSMGEAAKRRPKAKIQAKDANLGLWQRRLFEDVETVNFEQLRLLGKYKDLVLTESEGEVYFLDFVRKSGMKRRATIESKKGYNVTKIESMRADGTPYYEIEYQVKRYEGGRWFLAGYEFVRYPRPGSAAVFVPRVERKAVVKKVEYDVDVRDEMFALEIPDGAEVHDLILNILYFTGPGEDKILEMPGDLPDYSDLKAVIEIAYAARDKLLASSRGKAKLTLEKISRSEQATGRLQERIRNELGFDPRKAALLGQASWAVDWYNKGLKKRYDVFVAKPEESAEGMRPLLLLENKRIATDPEKGIHYNVRTKEAYITKRPVRANNPTNLGNYFRIQRLYQELHQGTLPDMLNLWQENGMEPTVSREKVEGHYCLKLKSTEEADPSNGKKYEKSLAYWVAPKMSYAVVKAEFRSGRGTGGGELPLREGYYASYEESDKFQGIWLLKDVTIVDNQGPATEKLTASLSDTEIGVDIPDSTFTFEGLGVPAGTRVYDR